MQNSIIPARSWEGGLRDEIPNVSPVAKRKKKGSQGAKRYPTVNPCQASSGVPPRVMHPEPGSPRGGFHLYIITSTPRVDAPRTGGARAAFVLPSRHTDCPAVHRICTETDRRIAIKR